MTASVALCSIGHRYGHFQALQSIELTIDAGEYVTLLGPSGCGKTTLLSILGGFLPPTQGEVHIGGEDVTYLPPARRPTTTMFQDYALFPHMSVQDNVAFGLRMQGVSRKERYASAASQLDLVGLLHSGSKKPHELSGGQRQRVALARALAVQPDVLLLDEPLGALDLKLRKTMQEELKTIQRKTGTTFIHVTHDQEEAMAIADRVIVMNNGCIEDIGTPERVYAQPASMFTAQFMGEMNLISGRSIEQGIETPLGLLPLSTSLSGDVKLCIRPEALGLVPSGTTLGNAIVEDVVFFGSYRRLHVRPVKSPDIVLIAHIQPHIKVKPDDEITLFVSEQTVQIFPDMSPT